MTVDQIAETDAGQQQLRTYNSASSMIKRNTWNAPAGTHWAIVGCVLADAAVPGDVDATLVPAIEALAEVTSVLDPRVWGQAPAQLLADSTPSAPTEYELRVLVEAALSGTIGFGGDVRNISERQTEQIKPPVNKKWMVVLLTLPSAISQASDISDLETAIEGITGITNCEHLIDGSVPTAGEGWQGGNFSATVRMRIDAVEVP